VKIPKPTEVDKDYFRSIVPDDPRVEIKPMFGNVAAFVNGNMFLGLFGSDVGVRLPEDDRASLLGVEGAGPFGPEGRSMGEYVGVRRPSSRLARRCRAHCGLVRAGL